MKKIISKLLTCIMVATAFGGLVGCSGETADGTEKIDVTRTQLYVYNHFGGYGSDWLNAVKARYEKLHENDVYEKGKKGIQIYVNNQKESLMTNSSKILSNRDEIYFTEDAYYYILKAEGCLGDITEAVTGKLDKFGEDGTVEEKLSKEQADFYGVEESDGTHYYGLPHYAGFNGFIYDEELFEENGYYFAKTATGSGLDDLFVTPDNPKKSAGPDGVEGTFDDGLPATYDEFFKLCDFMKSDGTTPFVWNGIAYGHYMGKLTEALQADYEGVEQMMLNFTLNGEAKTLATVSNGNVVIDKQSTKVTSADAPKVLARQAGKYYAVDFIERMVRGKDYYDSLVFSGAYSHMDAQDDFINSGKDGGHTAPIGMLYDGVWWESEAKNAFDNMVAARGDKYSSKNRKFAFMPFPKATQAEVEKAKNAPDNAKYTLCDTIFSLCFMKSNIADWKKPIAIDFIKFCNTDESLREFTRVTNTLKALNYEMTDDDLKEMNNYGKSLVRLRKASQVVYPLSTDPNYVNKQSHFIADNLYRSTVSNRDHQNPASAFKDFTVTAEQYFKGLADYQAKTWSV